MRWITAWLGALKGAAVVVETRQHRVVARTGQVSGNTLGPDRRRCAEFFDTVRGST